MCSTGCLSFYIGLSHFLLSNQILGNVIIFVEVKFQV
jgi:hypothetical protein